MMRHHLPLRIVRAKEVTPMNEVSIRLHIEPLDEDRFLATSPDVPGLIAEGRSITEATEIAQGLARKIAESCIEHGDPLPTALASLYEETTSVDLLVPVSVPSWGGSQGSSTGGLRAASVALGMCSTAQDPGATKFGVTSGLEGR